MMKIQKRLDKILDAARKRIQEEVGTLMGVSFSLTESSGSMISKENYIDQLTGKKIVAKLDISGEVEGSAALVIDIKDAIRLGGTLIMLPPAELDEVVRSEDYTEETEDSYGEIANIIAGSYTKEFEDSFPQKCRFVRKEQKLVSPLKIEIDSDEPFPNQWYYLVQSGMQLNKVQLGDIEILIPAQAFGLEIPGSDSADGSEPADAVETVQPQAEVREKEAEAEKSEAVQVEEQQEVEAEIPDKSIHSDVDIKKQKKLIDKLLKNCTHKISEEVSALLGVDVVLETESNKVMRKDEFFLEELSGKQVLAHMEVSDGAESECFHFVSLKDAIRIGSILIMLPPGELENAVSEEDFSADAEDAYGEIANIVAGVYTSLFKEQYTESLRFVKTNLEKISPMKVDCDSDDVIPNVPYYLSSSSIKINGKIFGNMSMLFPLDLLNLKLLAADEEVQPNASQDPLAQKDTVSGPPLGAGQQYPADEVEILIIENNRQEAEKFLRVLTDGGYSSRCISFRDTINAQITAQLKLVFIVMQEVNEEAYGVTIKVNTLSNAPIIAAGPEWTRSRVIKAVKYGVDDIILTPASTHDIKEKIDNNMVEMAA